jgi:FHA domain/Transglycosylase SLT domain
MEQFILKYNGDDGPEEYPVREGKTSFGRGSEADLRFADDGLSRLHATIYNEDGRIWVVDENSSNGTFVNGEKVGFSGEALSAGDVIRIGHVTDLRLTIDKKASEAGPPSASSQLETSSQASDSSILVPLVLTGIAIFIIASSIGIIAYTFSGNGGTETVRLGDERDDPDVEDDGFNNGNETDVPTPAPRQTETPTDSNGNPTPANENTELTNSPIARTNGTPSNIPAGKTYQRMSDQEKRAFIASRAAKVARIIGNKNTGPIPALAIDRIKAFADAYARRANKRRLGGCRFGDNLQATYERASKNAPFINRAFKQFGVDPQIGLYLAMIESEHCVCLQSPTGPLGMFQFTRATGRAYGLTVRRGASPSNPDERCKPQPAAVAAAKYIKFLTGRYGTGPSSVPLAIGSYNSGEGGLSRNLKTALESNEGLPRDFWALIANGEKLSKQFQAENFKYVPKFFAAAIVGENPRDFGLTLQPLSTYTK